MTEELGELDAILIAASATHEHGVPVIQALKAIVAFGKRGEKIPFALIDWLEASVNRVEKEDALNATTSSKQRGFSRAFGYTSSRGNPHEYGVRNFKLVWSIWRIHKLQNISLSKAIDAYVKLDPSCVGANGSTAYIDDLLEKHRLEVSELYEQWIDLMEENQTSH